MIAQSQSLATASNPRAWVDEITGLENTGLINGPEYKANVPGRTSNAFFETGETKGSVAFDGQWYDAVLLYDAFKDAIVVKHLGPSGRAWFVQLEKTRVQGFKIYDREFRNFQRGFHEVIFNSPDLLVVCKRAKITELRNRIFNYISNDEFFTVDGGRWKRLKSERAFIKLVEDKDDKAAVKAFIKRHQIRLRKFRNEDLLKVAAYVHSLRKPS